MARSSYEFSYSSGGDNSSGERYNPTVDESGGQVRIGRRGSSANRILERGVQMRGGGVRTRGGIRTEGIQARRRRRTDVIISGSGFTSIQADDLSGNSFTTYVEGAEGAEEEGRRGQVRGRRRRRPRRLGRERVRRHEEEEEEAATIVTSRHGIGNSCATNYNGRPSLENSCATNTQERPEIGNSQATNCIGVCHTLVQPQINEGGTRSGSIAIPNSQGRPENDNPQATNCTGVGSAFVQPEINEGRIRSGNIAIPNSPERPEIGNSPATNCTGVASDLVQPQINEGGTMSGNIAIPNSLARPKIGNSQATNCTRVGSALVQLQINDGGTRSGNIAIFDYTNMLECHLCSKTLSIPVSQCVNGHIACSSCCENLPINCPTCCFRVDIRCLYIEELLRRLKITCLNSKYGCKEILSYSMKLEHERSCTYEPCYCPVPGCGFDGSYKNLYRHFSCEHPDSATHFTFDSSFFVHMGANMKYKFLQADDNTLFILNYGVQTLGYVANIICMGPSCLLGEYSCELEASCVNGSSVKITLPSTQSLPKWTVCLPEKSVLLVPKDLIDSSWDHKIQICMCKKGLK